LEPNLLSKQEFMRKTHEKGFYDRIKSAYANILHESAAKNHALVIILRSFPPRRGSRGVAPAARQRRDPMLKKTIAAAFALVALGVACAQAAPARHVVHAATWRAPRHQAAAPNERRWADGPASQASSPDPVYFQQATHSGE
jgi:hypothetical protein